jgi:hypothetical protein
MADVVRTMMAATAHVPAAMMGPVMAPAAAGVAPGIRFIREGQDRKHHGGGSQKNLAH